MSRRVLKQKFYARPPLEVAPDLLGKVLCHERRGVKTSGRIVEVEAYLGSKDPASHAYRGRTPRNLVMFGPAGYSYIYFTYGSHFCMNVVTGEDGVASAVLIRALEPMDGISAMKRRRQKTKQIDLTSGPGKLAQALAVDRTLYGKDLTQKPLYIYEDDRSDDVDWVQKKRIGITRGVNLPYRFLVPDSPYLSRR